MKNHLLMTIIIMLSSLIMPLRATEKKGLNTTGKEPSIELSTQKKSTKKISRAKRLRDERKKKREQRKTMSHKSYDELKKEKIAKVTANDKEGAIRYLEKMVPLCNDLNELKSIMLELADLLFDTALYGKAADMYHEFTILYPGSNEVEYALYRAIVSNFKLTLDAEHDQSKTLATKELAQKFLERGDLFTTNKKEVENILAQCDEKLLAVEENIMRFYIKRGNTKSAQRRLDNMKKEFLDKNIPDVTVRIAHLESELGAQQLAIEPIKLAPETVVVAQTDQQQPEPTKEKSFVDRF